MSIIVTPVVATSHVPPPPSFFHIGSRDAEFCYVFHYVTSRKSLVRFPMRSDFLINQILPALWSTQPLTEMITRNIPGGKGWSARKADNLTAIYDPIAYKMCETRRLTNLSTFTACNRESFINYLFRK
jgi:hypothetical protein